MKKRLIWIHIMALVVGLVGFGWGLSQGSNQKPAGLIRAAAELEGVSPKLLAATADQDLMLLDRYGEEAVREIHKRPDLRRLYMSLGQMPQLASVAEKYGYQALRIPLYYMSHPAYVLGTKRQLTNVAGTAFDKVTSAPRSFKDFVVEEAGRVRRETFNTILSWPRRGLRSVGGMVESVTTIASDVYGLAKSSDHAVSIPETAWVTQSLTPRERAIIFLVQIEREGHNLLRQFAIKDDGTVEFLHVTGGAATVEMLLLGSIEELEKELKLGHSITPELAAGAILETVVVVGVFASIAKLASAGVGARQALIVRTATATGWRQSLLGWAAWLPRKTLGLLVNPKAWTAFGAYMLWYHPSVANHAIDLAADALGVPRLLMRAAVWGGIPALVVFLFPWPFILLWMAFKGLRGCYHLLRPARQPKAVPVPSS